MKKVIFLFTYLFSISIFFIGCGKDDDDSSLKSPKYEFISGKYNVQGNNTYSSIELGASGNYIVVKSTGNSRSTPIAKSNISHSSAFWKNNPIGISNSNKVRSTEDTVDDSIIFGTYTVNDDGSINLKGFGTLIIIYSGTSVTNMTLTPSNGVAITLNVEKENTYEDNELNNRLCRTWNMISTEESEYDEAGKLVYNFIGTFNIEKQIWSWSVNVDKLGWGGPENYNPSQVLFSKSGTYLVRYTDETILLRNWKWKSESAKTLYYKEIEDSDYSEEYWMTLTFSGKRATFTEKYSEDEGSSESITVLESVD